MENLNDTINELVRSIIETLYCAKCLINTQVDIEDNRYTLKLFIRHPFYAPNTISFECDSDEEFLSKIERELRENKLIRASFYKLILNERN